MVTAYRTTRKWLVHDRDTPLLESHVEFRTINLTPCRTCRGFIYLDAEHSCKQPSRAIPCLVGETWMVENTFLVLGLQFFGFNEFSLFILSRIAGG